MDVAELKTKSPAERAKLLTELRGELRALRFKVASGDLKTVHTIQDVRRTIARIATINRASQS